MSQNDFGVTPPSHALQHGQHRAYCLEVSDELSYALLGESDLDLLECLSNLLCALALDGDGRTIGQIERSKVKRVYLPRTDQYAHVRPTLCTSDRSQNMSSHSLSRL